MEQKTRRKARAHGTNKKLDDMRDFYEQFRAMPKEEQMYIKGRMDSYNDKRRLATTQIRESTESG